MQELFSRIQYDLKLDEELRPCDYFDIIGGSGPGAYVDESGMPLCNADRFYRMDAILLGSMRMTPSQAIDAYMKVAHLISVKPTQNDEERKSNSERFESAFRNVLEEASLKPDTPLLDKEGTKTYVASLEPYDWLRAAQCIVHSQYC